VPFTRISAKRSRSKGEECGFPAPRLTADQQQLTCVQCGAHRANCAARRTCSGEELHHYRSALTCRLRCDIALTLYTNRRELRCGRFCNAAAIKVKAHRRSAKRHHIVRHDHARRTLLHQQCGEGARTCGIESGQRLVSDHESGCGDECSGGSRLGALSAAEARHVTFRRVAREAGGGDRRVGTRRKKFGADAARLEREGDVI
jgi:hypothetical protein